MNNCYVFLGPSLPLAAAKEILPDARYLPPVRCGDMLQVLRLQPKCIVIIDGCFEECASVWHKEILQALSLGVTVIGAASMGALRAAELDQFGMVGVGDIYRRYASGDLKNDDAVALLHHESSGQYQAVTHALVDIEATLKLALQLNVIHQQDYQQLYLRAEETFYHQRRFDLLCATHHALQEWYRKEGLFSQKKIDAQAALQAAKADFSVKSITYNQTIPVKSLYCIQSAQPFFCNRAWLPEAEKIALYARLLDDDYMLVKRLARLMVLTNARLDSPLVEAMQKQSLQALSVDNLLYVQHFLILSGELTLDQYRKEKPQQFKALFYSVFLWRKIIEKIVGQGLQLTDQDLYQKLIMFRHFHGLIEPKALQQFFQEKQLDEQGFIGLVTSVTQFEYFVRSNNYLLVNDNFTIDNHFYLNDALHLTGFYDQAKQCMHDSEKHVKRIRAKLEKQGEPYLYSLSFNRGLTEFNDFVQ